jgi:hypothetical protein
MDEEDFCPYLESDCSKGPVQRVFMNESSITGPRFFSQENSEFENERTALEVNMLTQPPVFHIDLITSQMDAILLQIKTLLRM